MVDGKTTTVLVEFPSLSLTPLEIFLYLLIMNKDSKRMKKIFENLIYGRAASQKIDI